MSLSWQQRKARLASLLKSRGDEDADGVALDRLMHGQKVIGKTSKTTEIDTLRFKDKDLDIVGTLEYGQFGVIDVVTCRLNSCVYVRKSIEKKFALRTRDQCSPQFERDILLQAVKTDSPWAPHLLCAFQTPTHLALVMDYAEGGTLWDVLESSPDDGRVPESDLKWWVPQIVSAIHWCHSQGFAHRDIKPHNFVLTPDAHILLIDFGSAAPLLPPNVEGRQLLPRRHCLVPCGTCDYISPEILQAHEEALVALEMDDDDVVGTSKPAAMEGYGVETDWWSLGAMLYEMAYGFAPFFANDIRQTYIRIMNHEKSLRFDQKIPISHEFQHFLRRLLTHAKQRLGCRNVMEITDHPVFEGVNWSTLPNQIAPPNLHVPQFTYSEPKPCSAPPAAAPAEQAYDDSASISQGFAFSAFFQQSSSVSPGLSILRPSPAAGSTHLQSSNSAWKDTSSAAASFIGFSWGPTIDAFPEQEMSSPHGNAEATRHGVGQTTPRPLLRTPMHAQQTPMPVNHTQHILSVPLTWGPGRVFSTPGPLHMYSTPMKPYARSPYATLPRTSTVRRTAPRRNVSDREAMKQLVDCVGMSARKKVLESGRKPKILGVIGMRSMSGGTRERGMTSGKGASSSMRRKELRFDRFTTPIPGPDYSGASSSRSRSQIPVANANNDTNETSDIYYYSNEAHDPDQGVYSSSEGTDSEGGGPPSPSPSPRPGSAMSMTMMSRRSATPTISGYLSGPGTGRMRSGSGSLLVPLGDRSMTATMTMTTSSGLLSIPSAGPGNLEFRLGQPPGVPKATTKEAEPVSLPVAVAVNTDLPTLVSRLTRKKQSKSVSATLPLKYADDKINEKSVQERKSRLGHDVGLENVPSGLWLSELEQRHAAMMRDIEALEERFDGISLLLATRID